MTRTSAYAKAGITSTMHAVGHDLMINFSNGDSIYLVGVEQAALKSWFAGWIA